MISRALNRLSFGAALCSLSLCALLLPGPQSAARAEVPALIPVDSTAEFEAAVDRRLAPPAAAQSQVLFDRDRTGATRFVIGLQQQADYKISSLINPNRVVIDIDKAAVDLPAPVGDAPAGIIKSFRSGISAPGHTRVVIDMVAPVVVARTAIEAVQDDGSRRLVIDLVQMPDQHDEATAETDASGTGTTSGRATAHPPMPRRTTLQDITALPVYKPTIVLDPGHGGMDSGAQKFGTIEKEVVLAFGHRLKAKLEATGRYKVLMTRDTDVFVDLDERRLYAERNKAALFIAIHADSANTSARGATIYSLRHSVADDLMPSAKSEVRRDVLSHDEVRSISSSNADVDAVRGFLTDLAQREVEVNRDRTNVFTRSIIEYMGKTTNLKDNPDRTAQFRVLKTVKMPAVLIELAYVSNEEDASNLRSDAWRDKVTQSIVTAIESYFSNNIASLPL